MKKSTIFVILSLLSCGMPALRAQGILAGLGGRIAPYGSLRTYGIFDTRDVKAGTEDMFYYIPLDYSRNLVGQDIHSNPSFKMYAITTQLGVDVTPRRYGRMKTSGKLEADFYLLNGSSASLRLRQAYVDMYWDDLGYVENKFSIRVGQAWHPMAADLPYCVNVESGSPFSPHARSPQVMLDFGMFNGVSLTAGTLYPMQYLPTGPSGPSENYVKYGLIPELYAGISLKTKYFLARGGADFISLRPRWRTTTYNYSPDNPYDTGTRVHDRISMVSPFVYLQFEKGIFKVNAKSVFASGGDHLQLLGGYALYDWRDPFYYRYTPLRNSTSFVSFSVGRKLQFMCMGGYFRSLGTKHNLPVDGDAHCYPDYVYFFSSGEKDIAQMLRATPTLAYHVGGLTLALEYDGTMVQYGNEKALDNYARVRENLHWITNHRVLGVVMLSF